MIWNSHQCCAQCEWAGTTLAHRLNVVNTILYLLAVIAVVIAEAVYSQNIASRITWPIALGAVLWFFGVPRLLWRTNACRGCGQRMDVNLLPGTAPR